VELALDHYKKFEQNSAILKKFYDLGSRLNTGVAITPPKFKHRSKEILHSLQAFASEADPENVPASPEVKMSKEEMEM
jgi:hypothetical protein